MNQTDPQVPALSRSSGPWGALALLLMSYGLVLLAPVAFQSLRLAASNVARPAHVADWVPIALAIGLALLGGAAMVTVLKRLVRELELHPYAGVAAAFGVLMGSALIALRAPFQVGELSSGACAVLSLLVSIAGGALALRGGLASLTGGIVALAPAPLLAGYFWASAEHAQTLQGCLSALPNGHRTFLGLVSLFGLLLWLVAVSTRTSNCASSRAPRALDEAEFAIPLTRIKQPGPNTQMALAPTLLEQPQVTPAMATQRSAANEPTERFSVWSFHDSPPGPEDFEFPELRMHRRSLGIWLAVIFACVSALAGYMYTMGR